METEEERVKRIMEEMAKGTDMGHKLKYDRVRKKVRPVSSFHDPDDGIEITPNDADLFSDRPRHSDEKKKIELEGYSWK